MDVSAPWPARSQGSVPRKEERLPIGVPTMLPESKLCSTYQFTPMSSWRQEDPVLCEVHLKAKQRQSAVSTTKHQLYFVTLGHYLFSFLFFFSSSISATALAFDILVK